MKMFCLWNICFKKVKFEKSHEKNCLLGELAKVEPYSCFRFSELELDRSQDKEGLLHGRVGHEDIADSPTGVDLERPKIPHELHAGVLELRDEFEVKVAELVEDLVLVKYSKAPLVVANHVGVRLDEHGSWCHDEKIVNENIRYGSE